MLRRGPGGQHKGAPLCPVCYRRSKLTRYAPNWAWLPWMTACVRNKILSLYSGRMWGLREVLLQDEGLKEAAPRSWMFILMRCLCNTRLPLAPREGRERTPREQTNRDSKPLVLLDNRSGEVYASDIFCKNSAPGQLPSHFFFYEK